MFTPVTASTGNYCGGGHIKDQHKVEECNNAFRATPLFRVHISIVLFIRDKYTE